MTASATSTPHRLRQLSRLNHQVAPPSTATAAPPSDALAQTLRSALAPRAVELAESVQAIYDVEGRLVSAADLLVSKYARTPDVRAARLVAVSTLVAQLSDKTCL